MNDPSSFGRFWGHCRTQPDETVLDEVLDEVLMISVGQGRHQM
jgi:hypothetical protein